MPLAGLYAGFGKRLSSAGDLFRSPEYRGGLLLASPRGEFNARPITKGQELASLVVDRVQVTSLKNGRRRPESISGRHLQTMLRSEAFLQQFQPVDKIIDSPIHSEEFELLAPGYHDLGPDHRYLVRGSQPEIKRSQDRITQFLDVMDFQDHSDRTNAVAAALTVMLRNMWLGGKPLIAVTSTKSHGGKDTVIDFAVGIEEQVSVSYSSTDWPLERSIVATLNSHPRLGVIRIENIRSNGQSGPIASAFLERTITSSNPCFYSTTGHLPLSRPNDLVFALSTNEGSLSEDLMNRSLPIRLNPVGNVADRSSPIGNPRYDFLPRYRDEIAAELRGMIELWREHGKPLDFSVKHPFTAWAQAIGGILKVNDFKDFLRNYVSRKTADDPIRRGIALLGAHKPGEWLSATTWAENVQELGLQRQLIAKGSRENDQSRAREIGIVLTSHREETFEIETDAEKMVLRLEKKRARFHGHPPATRYRFVITERHDLPVESDEPEETAQPL
ncbi:hypothetical protein SH661x_002885 [Planctomicrobium sp. SH661]|uniref:hypothetical protein n=1 Tax=Planctomicrobium sp. SH661 TaxID=3448124 RepID=UPI003F5B3883